MGTKMKKIVVLCCQVYYENLLISESLNKLRKFDWRDWDVIELEKLDW